MIDITYRTIGPWGPGKGANLQASEVDNNFWSAAVAIDALINDPPEANGIGAISVSGTQMTIVLNDGTVMGPYTIPVLTFRWRGEWNPSTPYAELDVFTKDAVGIFLVQIAYTSGTDWDPNVTDGSGNLILKQLFGAVDAGLRNLPDVRISTDGLHSGDALIWVAEDGFWENFTLGGMAYQDPSFVNITGGVITGMSNPADASDVATKAYVDSAVVGGTPPIPPLTMLCNINTFTAVPSAPQSLSNYLDAAFGSTVVGNIIYRSGAVWQVLPPGAPGTILQCNGAGVDITWTAAPGLGVVSITAGPGISTGGAPITSTGTVSLANVSDGQLLADISGSAAAPTGVTLSAYLDHVLSSSRGTILTRNVSGWVSLNPGTSGYYLKTQGTGADLMWDAPPGAGTVLSVGSGTGLTGGPITGSGTLSLAPIASGNVLANTSGSSAAPIPTTVSLLLDTVFASGRGNVLYRGASSWSALAPGTSGQFLSTGGTTADPSWQNAPTSGGSVPNLRILANISGSAGVPTGNTLSAIFDAILSSSRGSVIYRTNSGWVALAPGTAGQVLTTAGGSADPTWTTNGGGSLGIASPAAQDTLSYNTSSGKFENVRARYHLGTYVPGTMSASQNLLFHRFSKAVTIPANFGAYLGHISEAAGMVAATASTVITISKALSGTPTTFATVATITFAAGAVLGTFSTQAAITFAQGDLIRVRGPATADTSFSDFTATIMGWET
jgi:hypothetical protein